MNTPMFQSRNKIIAPIYFGVGILIAIFFLRPVYAEYIEKTVIKRQVESQKMTLTTELASLKSIQDNLDTILSQDKIEIINKLAKKFSVSDIMSIVLFNDFTKDSVGKKAVITIPSISVWEGTKQPNGLTLGTVNLSLTGKSIADIIDYITYITQNTPYIFTIDSINLPIDTNPDEALSGSYSLGISLSIYYY